MTEAKLLTTLLDPLKVNGRQTEGLPVILVLWVGSFVMTLAKSVVNQVGAPTCQSADCIIELAEVELTPDATLMPEPLMLL